MDRVRKEVQSAVAETGKGVLAVASAANHRERILKAAMTLLAKGGRDALTTRAVAEAAGVQPPILYRLFNDKAGLLNAVADYGFGVYMAKKHPSVSTEDPVESLRAGWKVHIQFGLTHPELYLLMYADPRPTTESPAAERSHHLLQGHMQRVAAAGRLRVTEEQAAHLFHAAACGIVMVLLDMAGKQRDMSLSDTACEAALAAIVTDRSILPAPTMAAAATALRALLTGVPAEHPSEPIAFTEAERDLLIEWLNRLTRHSAQMRTRRQPRPD